MSSLEDEVKELSFLDKLDYLIEYGELDFWEERRNPPNLSSDEFKQVMSRIPAVLNLKWVER